MVLGIIALVVLNLFLLRWISGEIQAMKGRLSELTSETQSLRSLALERPYWETRAAWLAANEPTPYAGQTTDSAFAERVQREIRQFDLVIESQQLLGSETIGEWVATPMDLTLRGNLQSIVRWLQSAQGPGKFLSVQSFNLRQGDDGTNMVLRIRLRQIFRGETKEDDNV